ncbi:hypothetical protein NEOLEDRAFT_392347 [Neolentinus lepideus HHB14362 ss-1]|uniref:DUF6699 domain-containing protein n=1 Tax=Neolentinus lepideus HHB14362 ss-1 TaxID=1314782 RepID=A0A165S7D4_9AGAM|nr:hypothetical protein NEOLEDRAFT_392347 [Neolentinus lepideus HHB14362 ss-1]
MSHGEAMWHFACLNSLRTPTVAATPLPRPCLCRYCAYIPVPGGCIPSEDRPVACQEYRDPVTGAPLRRPHRRRDENHTPAHRITRPSRSILRGSPGGPQTPLMSRGGFNPGIALPASPVLTPQTTALCIASPPAVVPQIITSPYFMTGHLPPLSIPSPVITVPMLAPVNPVVPAVIPEPVSPEVAFPPRLEPPSVRVGGADSPRQIADASLTVPATWHWSAQPPILTPYVPPIAVPAAAPVQTPNQIVYVTPSGNFTWTPHPQPHPQIPSAVFFPSNPVTGSNHATFVPVWDPNAAMSVSGGYPLPGTAPTWVAPAWPPVPVPGTDILMRLAPCLIPNPVNALLPQIIWDVAKSPVTARKLTGRHIILDMMEDFRQPATAPIVRKLIIVCDFGSLRTLWPPVELQQDRPISVWDIMNAIYEFFQKRLRRREFEYIKALQPDNEAILRDAFYRRCQDSPTLYDWEIQQGYKRVDVLGDSRVWWGVWVTYNPDNTWQLNLGLMPLRQP